MPNSNKKINARLVSKYVILILVPIVIVVFLYNYIYMPKSHKKNTNLNKQLPHNLQVNNKVETNISDINDKGRLEINLETQAFKTKYGILTAVKTTVIDNNNDTPKDNKESVDYIEEAPRDHDILLDNKKVFSGSAAIIEYKMEISDHIVLAIITDEGGSMGNVAYHILDIKPDKTVIEKRVLNSWAGTIFLQSEKCINAKTPDSRPYADITDYSLFTYCIDKSTPQGVKDFSKPDSYYKNKFSSYKSKQIYDLAIADQCIDEGKLSEATQCIDKYCFMLKSKTQKDNDKYTDILEKSCS